MSDAIEVVHDIERVHYYESRKCAVRIELANRSDIVDTADTGIGKVNTNWVPTSLALTFEQNGDEPWQLDALLTVNLRLKSGGISAHVDRNVGFEGLDGRRVLWGRHYPYVPIPDWLPALIEAHAPEGWEW